MEKPTSPVYTLEVAEALDVFHSSRKGLVSHEATRRLQQFGPNAIPTKKPSLLKRIIEPFSSVFVASC